MVLQRQHQCLRSKLLHLGSEPNIRSRRLSHFQHEHEPDRGPDVQRKTYNSCTTDDDSGDETFVYSGGEETGKSIVFAVPLTVEGKNYYLSDADDGIQCDQWLRFEIVVAHGNGLPPSLNQPPPPPPLAPDQSPPSANATTNQVQNFYNGGVSKIRFCGGVSFLLLLLFSSGFVL